MGTPMRIGGGCSFKSFKTATYKLHFFEAPSGLKMILTTAPNIGNLAECMDHIYGDIFVEYVVKNPLYIPGDKFLFETFTLALNKYLISLNILQ